MFQLTCMPSVSKFREPMNIAVPLATITTWRLKKSGSTWIPDGATGDYAPAISRVSGLSSSLKYETGNDGAMRPCSHDIKRYLALPVSDTVAVWDNSAFKPSLTKAPGWSYSGNQRYCHQKTYGQYLAGVTSVPNRVDTIQWASLGQTALDSMMPSFGGQNSLVNFVFELKDFKKLGLSLTSGFVSKLNVIRAALGFDHWDKPLAKLAKAHLSYQFGWRPLFADLAKMYDSLSNFNSKFKTIVALANTDLQKHFSTKVNGTDSSESTYYYSGNITPPLRPGYTGYTGRTRVLLDKADKVQYNATLRYRYPLPPELTSAGGKAKAFHDALGLQVNPAIIWNAIPFSFLVDWVVNVSSWLNKLRIDNIRFKTEIRGFCHSAVQTRIVRYMVESTQYGISDVSNNQFNTYCQNQETDTCYIRTYRRKTGIPDFLSSMQTSGLNEREFLLGGSLIRANRR